MKPGNRLKPVKDFRFYKRNLPHYEHPGSVYFITFRTAQGVTLSDKAKDIAFSSLKFLADKKYRLHSCVVMETHVHCIVQPLAESEGAFYSMAQIIHSVKSYSANRIQKLLNRKGNVWLDENYDRIIRDDEEYLEKMSYVMHNPVKARLVEKPEDYRWLFVAGSPH
ncbi:MAG: transposase [Dehalococcoidia bacterium]|nr:transposase [Dehalococcoidia bacterium]